MNGGELFGVPVGLVDRDEYLVHFVYCLVHARLERRSSKNNNSWLKFTQENARLHLSPHLTIEKEAAACSRSPTRPISVKYFPEHMPSSSGDTTSSETADSSSTLEEIFWAHAEGLNPTLPH